MHKRRVNLFERDGCTPGGEGSVWGPEAGDPPGPSFPEGLLDQLALRRRVYPPEGAFARLLLRPRHFDEIAVQGQVVTNRVLQQNKRQKGGVQMFAPVTPLPLLRGSRHQPASLYLQSCSTGSSL